MAPTDAPAPRVTRWALRPISEVFDALADPYTYPSWLVGCREIRKVDEGWPAPGTRFHHRVGLVGPLTVNDDTESIEVASPRHLALEVRFRPFGRGRVDFHLSEVVDARGACTRIDMDEQPIGPLRLAEPVLAPTIVARNQASLDAFVARLNAPAEHRDDD